MPLLRRHLLLGSLGSGLRAGPPVRREVFLRSPGKGTAVMAYAYYTRPRGGEMMSIEQRWSRSDTIDVAYIRRSSDYGRTWSAPVERATGEKRPEGTLRRHPRGGWIDPATGRFLEFWLEGILPTDDPLEGLRQWNIYYTVDSGPVHQVIHKGAGFDARHPLPGVHTGKNCVMLGDNTCQPIAGAGGSILLPVSISPLAPDGSLANPGGGYTWHDAAVLHGRWRSDRLEWEMSDVVRGDPGRSTRGVVEPTITRLDSRRLLMVMRGSNDRKPAVPGLKWVSFSSDGGWKWSEPRPWTYAGGDSFFSPSACSQLLRHSSGRLYWLGNITPENPRGNRPRYPFFCGEVDRASGLLRRDRLIQVDSLAPGESDLLTLSNFYAREDRRTREIAVHMTRLFAFPDGWEGDAMLYRIRV
ncbi:MAG: sialidase family protein [Bryobacteraceae bacterium]